MISVIILILLIFNTFLTFRIHNQVKQIVTRPGEWPAYNYGICSFSYTHALLKAQKLKEQGVLDKLQPKYVLLGCWSGLPSRSRLPFPPLASKQLPMPAANMTKVGAEVRIQAGDKVGGGKMVKME